MEEMETIPFPAGPALILFMEEQEMTRSHLMEREILSMLEMGIIQLLLVAMLMEESSPQAMGMIVM